MRPLPTRKLDKRIMRVWRLSALVNVVLWSLVCIVPMLVALLVLVNSGARGSDARTGALVLNICLWALVALAVLLLVLFVVVIPAIRYRQWSFDVYAEEIDIHKGIFWRKRIIIPLIRVQNVDTRQGPIMRANGLASFTAATAAGEHEIPGLDVAEADALRDHVAMLARIAQEDV
ncbi:MAG: PH domain-containing protein [Coriobacteriales bacterium]|jgi:membrane protein YdbS with pleckstrin-like domain|nr:PH domain-containing protein [Coriobacteriales bacterium]